MQFWPGWKHAGSKVSRRSGSWSRKVPPDALGSVHVLSFTERMRLSARMARASRGPEKPLLRQKQVS